MLQKQHNMKAVILNEAGPAEQLQIGDLQHEDQREGDSISDVLSHFLFCYTTPAILSQPSSGRRRAVPHWD